ncbi:MAG TPA: hypothetical protein VK474_04945 [Chthoniobacterales bacterium]|nr:hypothetical protein [Chthoniobacterales bacterium]
MPNYGYHLARAKGAVTRRLYRSLLPVIARRQVKPAATLPFDVFSYSGESALPEQVASIRSFLKHAGRPEKFTVVSDGTYSASSIELLERLDSAVTVSNAGQWIPVGLPPEVYPYLTDHPTGKQLALIMSLPVERPVLYTDSDVLFFPGARDLAAVAEARGVPALYLADCQFAGDERLLRNAPERQNPVNTGLLMLFQKLDWSRSLERLSQLGGEPTFFTNQTMAHLTMHANGAAPFDQRKYILQLDDQFVYPDRYAGAAIALRHYVNPVRHKFWASLN